jgi:hypothetical protein
VNQWSVESPWIFFGVGGVVVAYVLYMMIRRGKGDRPGNPDRELEL